MPRRIILNFICGCEGRFENTDFNFPTEKSQEFFPLFFYVQFERIVPACAQENGMQTKLS